MLPFSHLAILDLDIDKIPNPLCMVVTHILIVARLVITKNWKAQYAPGQELWSM